MKDLQREIELLNGKIKQGNNDKTRICGILDEKVSDFCDNMDAHAILNALCYSDPMSTL